MFDLNEVLNFVTKIHEEALETAPMPKVAQGMGYTHPSSTPFYRRMVAARLFGLVSKTGAELTPRARSYLKPDSEDAQPRALQDAVLGIVPYAEEVQRYSGRRMNVNFVANGFATRFGLTDGCAMTCARAFEASLRIAGLLSVDGTIGVRSSAQKTIAVSAPSPSAAPAEEVTPAATAAANGSNRTHILPLAKNRTVSVSAPLDISKKEIERLKRWLEDALYIEPDDQTPNTPPNP